jgi:hypothetical protein
MTGILTRSRYTCETIFVDQYSRAGYVHLQKSTSAEDTLEAKTAFEQWAQSKGVMINQYHADNDIFKANKWMSACAIKVQALTFAGVGAHHSNGMAERRIKEVQDMAQTMLIHAMKRWQSCSSMHLWP